MDSVSYPLLNEKSRWHLLGLWILVSGAGAAGAWLIAIILTLPFTFGRGAPGKLVMSAFGLTYGTVLGFAQWLFLRDKMKRSGWWILATAIGEVFYWYTNPSGVSFEVFQAALRGAALGVSQYTVLRRWVKKAVWWIFATTVGELLGELSVSFLRGNGHPDPVVLVQPALIQVFVGAATGIALTVFFTRTSIEDNSVEHY